MKGEDAGGYGFYACKAPVMSVEILFFREWPHICLQIGNSE